LLPLQAALEQLAFDELIVDTGNRMIRQGEIRLKESISKANYNNAIAFFSKNGVRGSEDEEMVRQWNDVLVHFQNLISR
jgi:glycerol-3-phosphate O-acyltransferase